jgi:hypothetical protein
MAPQTYLVPLDFFKGAEIALQHARRINRENTGKLVLLHVINENMFHSRKIMPRSHTEKQARDGLKQMPGVRASGPMNTRAWFCGDGIYSERLQVTPRNFTRQ